MELSFKDAYVHFRTFSNDEPLNTSIEYINQSALLTGLCIFCIGKEQIIGTNNIM